MSAANHPCIEARGLTLWRGDRCLFRALDLEAAPAKALLVTGANGSGKSTLLRVLCGLTAAEEGEVLWRGRPIGSVREDFVAALAYSGHANGLKLDLSAWENLRFAARMREMPDDGWDGLLDALGIGGCADLPVRHLSAGQQRRVALTRVLGSGALVWILDEPFTNLDSAGRQLINQRCAEHLEQGGLLIMASHEQPALDPELVRKISLDEAR